MSRPHLLLLPGLLCDDALWRYQAEHLGDIAETTIGNLTPYDSIAKMGDAMLASAPEIFALAGLSMGGYVAQYIMNKAPERVSHLALVDTSARPDTPAQAQRRKDFMKLGREGKFTGVRRQMMELLIHPARLSDEALCEAIMEMTARVGVDAFIREQTAILNRGDYTAGLKKVRCPAMVVCGREDGLTPMPVQEELVALTAGSRLIVIEEAGHLPPMEQPPAMTAVLRCLLSETGAAPSIV